MSVIIDFASSLSASVTLITSKLYPHFWYLYCCVNGSNAACPPRWISLDQFQAIGPTSSLPQPNQGHTAYETWIDMNTSLTHKRFLQSAPTLMNKLKCIYAVIFLFFKRDTLITSQRHHRTAVLWCGIILRAQKPSVWFVHNRIWITLICD